MADRQPMVTGILIGGKSRRMGADKALLPWRDTTILESIVQTARAVTPHCVLLGHIDALPESLIELPRLSDPYPNIGPMAGLHALLTHHPDSWCLLLSCDIPHVTVQTIAGLTQCISPNTKVISYVVNGHIEPCCALYDPSILPEMTNAITATRYGLGVLIKSLPHTKLCADAAIQQSLQNINTPDDYADPAQQE